MAGMPTYMIVSKDDGTWLEFSSRQGRSVVIRLESLAEDKGNLSGAILKEWCEEFRAWVSLFPFTQGGDLSRQSIRDERDVTKAVGKVTVTPKEVMNPKGPTYF